jgi:hypothetical protein
MSHLLTNNPSGEECQKRRIKWCNDVSACRVQKTARALTSQAWQCHTLLLLSSPPLARGGGWRWAGRQNTFDCKIKNRHIHKNCNSAQLYDCLVRFALQKSRYLWCTSSLKIVKFVTKRAFIKICTVKIFEANDRRSYI